MMEIISALSVRILLEALNLILNNILSDKKKNKSLSMLDIRGGHMGKIFVLSVTDHEEYVLSRIMEIIAAESGFDNIVTSKPCNTLVFPGLELRLQETPVSRNGELIALTHREIAT